MIKFLAVGHKSSASCMPSLCWSPTIGCHVAFAMTVVAFSALLVTSLVHSPAALVEVYSTWNSSASNGGLLWNVTELCIIACPWQPSHSIGQLHVPLICNLCPDATKHKIDRNVQHAAKATQSLKAFGQEM